MSINSLTNTGSKYVNNQPNVTDKSTAGVRDSAHASQKLIYQGEKIKMLKPLPFYRELHPKTQKISIFSRSYEIIIKVEYLLAARKP